MRTSIWRGQNVVLASLIAGSFGAGCGGQVSGGAQQLDWRSFNCLGSITTPTGPVTLGTGNAPPLLVCEPDSTPANQVVSDCQDRCSEQLPVYATKFGLPPDQASTLLKCDIKTEAKSAVNATDCAKNGPVGQTGQALSATSRYLQGGFADYVANVSGGIHVEVHVPVFSNPTADPGVHGTIAYTITPPSGPCPAGGCTVDFSSISLNVDNFNISLPLGPIDVDSHDINNLTIANDGDVLATIDDAGNFSIPDSTAQFFVNLDNDGTHSSTNKANPALTGRIDRTTGTVHIDGLKITDHDTDFNVGNVDGSNIASPPLPQIAVAPSIECNATGGANASYSAAGTTDPDGNPIAAYFWQINGQSAGANVQSTGFFQLGSSTLRVVAFDSTFAGAVTQTPVQVVDTTPPTFPSLADQTVTLCDPMADSTTVAVPAPTDICDPNLTVTGQVISTNGVPLGTPRPVTGGAVQMGTGTSVVQWTATDHSGNSTTTLQTFRVRPAIYASGEDVHIGINAVVRVTDTVMAAIGNSGTDQVFIDPQAHVGDLLSVGKVVLGFRSRVDGDVLAASTILKDPTSVVTGIQTQHGVVSLAPPLGLGGVTFPAQSSGQVLALLNTTTINPGTYDTIIVGPGATLHMNPGTYFVRFMQISLGSHVELDETAGGTRLFVSDHLDYAGSVVTVAGNALDFVLGYKRNDLVILNSPFTGTFVGPQATVSIQTLSLQTRPTFTGRLFARGISLDHDGTITCASPSVAGADSVLAETNPAIAGGGTHTLSVKLAEDAPASDGGTFRPESACSVGAVGSSRTAPFAAIPLLGALAALVRRRGARRRRSQ